LSFSAREAGAAAELAANRKSDKYADLPQSHLFQPIALETGSVNSSTVSFFSDLSRRISTVPGDIRESSSLPISAHRNHHPVVQLCVFLVTVSFPATTLTSSHSSFLFLTFLALGIFTPWGKKII